MSGEIPSELGQAHKVRRIIREAGDKMVAAGALPVDVGFGTFCAALDAAEQFAGEGMAAIEWLRSACDVMEHSLLNGAPRVPE
ncbi:hypothetical protein [Novosphingobium sp.]|uniref:hypothetical protein n=1 Tax=Novosphingobium sp. TaxID=1874826 RepID=UPI001D8CA6A6|nr:hypothetical protein [Novosphingobium sp.]MBX9662579.1 hypothetical protein [Novosphingobium sp.]